MKGPDKYTGIPKISADGKWAIYSYYGQLYSWNYYPSSEGPNKWNRWKIKGVNNIADIVPRPTQNDLVLVRWNGEFKFDLINLKSREIIIRFSIYTNTNEDPFNENKLSAKISVSYPYHQGKLGSVTTLNNYSKAPNIIEPVVYNIRGIDISTDGSAGISGTTLGDVVLLEFGHNPQASLLHAFDCWVSEVAISSESRTIIATSNKNEVVVWSF